jgi:acid phosphatase type 7
VLVGAGDIANCGSPGSNATANLLDGILGTVFTAGDNAYPHGNAGNFRDCYEPTWGRHRDRTYPTAGNHEYESPGAGPYFDYFGDRAGPRGLGYYTYDVATWRVFALNSEIDARESSVQVQWLRSELTSRPSECAVAIWHRPRFSSGPNGNQADMRDLFRATYDLGVELVLNGHDHLYERFSPQDHDGRPDFARGVRQFTVGTGGVALYVPLNPARANSERIGQAWGVLKLTLRPRAYDWEFIPAGDTSFRDTGSGTCH